MSSKNLFVAVLRVLFSFIAFLLALVITIYSFTFMKKVEFRPSETITPAKKEPINTEKQLNEIIVFYLKEMNLENNPYEIFIINDEYINVFIKETDNNYRSFIINKTNSQLVKIDKIIKNDSIEEFNSLIHKYLVQKYPKFIVEGLESSGDIAYKISNSNIEVYYSNFITNPQYNGEIKITLNWSDIKDIVIYPINLEDIENIAVDDNLLHLDPNKTTVAFTFDDGPADTTYSLVDTLIDNKVSVTFFILGDKILKYQDVILKGLENGNEYGSHSYSHPYLTKLNNTKLDYQIYETNRIFKELTGLDLKLLRPPYGSISNKIVNRYDMTYIMWSMDTLDWKNRDVLYVRDFTLENISDGDIILFHDLHLTTVEAIKLILPELFVRDIQVTTVSKLAELKAQSIETKQFYRDFKSE